jgi:single-strand DNA-binding protein
MAGINKVILVGNLGRDPEVRYTQAQVPVCSFPMATSETYKDRQTGERMTQTEWHNVVLWRGQAEVAQRFLRKGSLVYIEGKLRTRNWEDAQGQRRYTTEVVGEVLQLLDRPDAPPAQGSSDGSRVMPPAGNPQPAEAYPSPASETAVPSPQAPATPAFPASQGEFGEEVGEDLPF